MSKFFEILLFRPLLLFLTLSFFSVEVSAEKDISLGDEGSGLSEQNTNSQILESRLAYVIPIKDQIGPPILDILRRGLKDAIRTNAQIVLLDMDTPGGELGVTLEIMEEIIENLERFEGSIITYVNDEAISAGAYIAIATSEIAFSPNSQIGAAEAVSGGGANIDSSMKRKINSYLKAKIRNYSGNHRYRSQVMSAMMDANETFLIEGEPLKAKDGSVIKKAGELLTLTGEEACQLYGDPPAPLLGFGVFDSYEDILDQRWGDKTYEIIEMEINWAEEIGLWLNGIAPIILSVGLVCIFVEFKTPGFGIFGVAGILLLLVFFGSKYVAGLAGQEELLVFLLGVCLVLVEIFLAPGLVLPGIIGFFMMLGAVFWAMVDVWPTPNFEWNMEVFRLPIWEFFQSLGIAFVLGIIVTLVLPKTPLWQSLVLSTTIGGNLDKKDGLKKMSKDLIGSRGFTVSELFPTGQIEIEGKKFEARANLGKISKGEKIRVVKSSGFDLVVELDIT